MTFVIVMLAMLAFMYFLLIRPQRANQRKTREMLERLAPGDEIVTIGGIYGDVIEVDDQKVVLEIAEDVHIEVARRAIASIVPPETEDAAEDLDDEELDDEELDDAGKIEDGEEPGAEAEDGAEAAGRDGDASVEVEERAR